MIEPGANVWVPTSDDLADAHLTALLGRFGLTDYDALYRFSLDHETEYWIGVLDFLKVAWSRPPESYVDLSRGPEFPRWFPGGELNWVDTILAWSADPIAASRTAVVAERENGAVSRVTFADLATQVCAFAAGLVQHGVRRGDRIGLLCENGLEATVSLLAIAYIGAIVVPLFSGFGPDAVASRLLACEARGLIASTGFDRRGGRVEVGATVREARLSLPSMDLLIWKAGAGEAVPDDGVAWSAVMAAAARPLSSARMSPDDPFMVIYTSGTTGQPKGAVHTHGGFPIKIAHDAAVHLDLGPGDIFCWPADMGWIAGALVLAAALMRGATLVCYDGAPDFPDWSRVGRLVARHRITHLGSAPTLIRGLAANAAISTAADLSTIELMVTAGEVIDPEHFCWFQRAFGGARRPLINYTGGTEASGAILSSVVARPIRPAGFNSASPGVRAAVVDANGRPVTDMIGELAILGPFVGMTRSFWQDDRRYIETYWRTVPGMWIHGDLAMRTSAGDFFMLGRSDDTLKVAGKRLGPAEVEEVLLELPDVAEAAAIGVEDPVKGHKLVVFIVAAPGSSDAATALSDTVCRQVERRLGRPFRPSAVHAVRLLPKTRSSKVMRRLIRAAYCGLPLGDISALDNPAALDEIRRTAPRR